MSKRAERLEDSTEAARDYWDAHLGNILGAVTELRAEMSKTRNAVALQGSEVRPITASGQVATSGGRLMGYGIRETSGVNPATVYLRDGSDPNGDLIVPIQLVAGESIRDTWAPGLSYLNGLYVHVFAGTVEGAVYVGAVD